LSYQKINKLSKTKRHDRRVVVFAMLPGPPLKTGKRVLTNNATDSKGTPWGGAEDLQFNSKRLLFFSE